MSEPVRPERSALSALLLLSGWAWILIGLGIIVFSRFTDFMLALRPLLIGAVSLGWVFYRESVER